MSWRPGRGTADLRCLQTLRSFRSVCSAESASAFHSFISLLSFKGLSKGRMTMMMAFLLSFPSLLREIKKRRKKRKMNIRRIANHRARVALLVVIQRFEREERKKIGLYIRSFCLFLNHKKRERKKGVENENVVCFLIMKIQEWDQKQEWRQKQRQGWQSHQKKKKKMKKKKKKKWVVETREGRGECGALRLRIQGQRSSPGEKRALCRRRQS